jgi:hypothetical protein
MPPAPPHEGIGELLRSLEKAARGRRVSIDDIVAQMGDRSFAAVLLIAALIMVSPASGIPGSPTVFGLFVIVIVAQMLAGRTHVWLPAVLSRRRISGRQLRLAIGFLRRPVALLEPLFRERLVLLANPPGSIPALAICLLLALVSPLMELVPFAISGAALVIAAFSAGILLRDGLLMVFGYGLVALGAAALMILL